MAKIQLTGTGGAPHISSMGVTFQAGEGDTLEFHQLTEGNAGLYSTGVYIDDQPKCFINFSISEYLGTEVKYIDNSNSQEYTFELTNSNINLST
jgi:hypothetical protein